MCGWCLAFCTSVVLNTVGQSTTPDSKENKQADAGSRRFRRHFLCGALLCNFLSTESMKVYLHMSNGNVQQNLLCPVKRRRLQITDSVGSRLSVQDARMVFHICIAGY